MSKLNLFLPLTKVDLDERRVHGVATAEAPDRAGEICDYESTKPYFEAWSAEAEAASGGKSLGAVRAMHGRVAAGKLTDISFDDEGKRILVAAKIVDDDEWQKVMEGVYTHRGARSKSDRDLRRPRWIQVRRQRPCPGTARHRPPVLTGESRELVQTHVAQRRIDRGPTRRHPGKRGGRRSGCTTRSDRCTRRRHHARTCPSGSRVAADYAANDTFCLAAGAISAWQDAAFSRRTPCG